MSGEIERHEFHKAVRRGDFDELLHAPPPSAAAVAAAEAEATAAPHVLETGRSRVDSQDFSQRLGQHRQRRSRESMDQSSPAKAHSVSFAAQTQTSVDSAEDATDAAAPAPSFARSHSGQAVAGRVGLTAAKTKHLRDIFNLADADHSGTIGVHELMEILRDESITGAGGRVAPHPWPVMPSPGVVIRYVGVLVRQAARCMTLPRNTSRASCRPSTRSACRRGWPLLPFFSRRPFPRSAHPVAAAAATASWTWTSSCLPSSTW